MGRGDVRELAEVAAALPVEVGGWKSIGPGRRIEGEGIFDYIDGAGEIYRAYGYRALFTRVYEKADGPRIIADLFDMGEARNAFGIFTHGLEGEDVGIGQGSLYNGGLLSFWKGRYFVSLFVEEETGGAREAVLELGRSAAAAVRESGTRPGIVDFLPPADLDPGSIRYFYDPLILNSFFYLADDNILGLGTECEAVLGAYRGELEGARLLLVRYPNAARAEAAESEFRKVYLPGAGEGGGEQTENGRWTVCRRRGLRLEIVFDAPDESCARALLDAVRGPAVPGRASEGKSDKPRGE